MKFLLTFLLFLTTLFAHGSEQVHSHFFSSLHLIDFTLVAVGSIVLFSTYKFFKKEQF